MPPSQISFYRFPSVIPILSSGYRASKRAVRFSDAIICVIKL
jgi:hypothetical protein